MLTASRCGLAQRFPGAALYEGYGHTPDGEFKHVHFTGAVEADILYEPRCSPEVVCFVEDEQGIEGVQQRHSHASLHTTAAFQLIRWSDVDLISLVEDAKHFLTARKEMSCS